MVFDLFGSDSGKSSPTRRKPTKAEKYVIWNKYIGADKTEGKCYCCKRMTIHIMDFDVGHNKALSKGGKNDISNYRPICRLCNSSMGTMSIESYKKKLNPRKKSTLKKTTKIKKPANARRKKSNDDFSILGFKI
jgi:5-methylcytosine-specific restriction endonuclease McrA